MLYHGTCSAFCKAIENEGWKLNGHPYDFNELRQVLAALEAIGLDEISVAYGTVKDFTFGQGDSYVGDKGAAFTDNYLLARHYTSKKCGETLQRVHDMINEFSSIVKDSILRNKHLSHLRENVENVLAYVFGEEPDYLPEGYVFPEPARQAINQRKQKLHSQIRNTMNDSFLKQTADRLAEIWKKYDEMTCSAYPVVYVIAGKPEWFENWSHDMHNLNYDIRAKQDIGSEAIKYRINFPNGTDGYKPKMNENGYSEFLQVTRGNLRPREGSSSGQK
jgi:hypothetical protein